MDAKQIELKLDFNSVNSILEALTELKYKVAYPIIQEIVRQTNSQSTNT